MVGRGKTALLKYMDENPGADLILNWKYIIDMGSRAIRVTKEIALWSQESTNSPWRRGVWYRIHPPYKVGWFESARKSGPNPCPTGEWEEADPSNAPSGVLEYKGDYVVFNGGFLIVEDEGLGREIVGTFTPLSEAAETRVTERGSHWGETVRAIADFASRPGPCGAPIICLPQNDDPDHPVNLVLAERRRGNTRECILRISSLEKNSDVFTTEEFRSNEYFLDDSGKFHQLNVGLDRDSDNQNVRFEGLVDVMPFVFETGTAEEAYPFGLGPFRFYVGFEPADPDAQSPHSLFLGEMERIVFDPNASCQSCT